MEIFKSCTKPWIYFVHWNATYGLYLNVYRPHTCSPFIQKWRRKLLDFAFCGAKWHSFLINIGSWNGLLFDDSKRFWTNINWSSIALWGNIPQHNYDKYAQNFIQRDSIESAVKYQLYGQGSLSIYQFDMFTPCSNTNFYIQHATHCLINTWTC